MADIAVGFTVSAVREQYLRQALDSWTRVRGVQETHLVFCVEPVPRFPLKEFTQWVADNFSSAEVVANTKVLGCLRNTRQAFEAAFAHGAQFAVMAEEDIEVATDTLEYFRWAEETYRGAQDVVMACAHVKASGAPHPRAVVRASWFSPLVCGTWKDRWEGFVVPGWKGWTGSEWDSPDSQAWDTNLRHQIRASGHNCVFPARSRALHIGEFSTWLAPVVSEYLYGDTQSSCFCTDNPPQDYREVPFGSVPGILV